MIDEMPDTMNRREFAFTAGAALLAGCMNTGDPLPILSGDPAHLVARPKTPNRSPTLGSTPLGLGGNRDGFLYVPQSYVATRPASLMVLLHGAGRSSEDWANSPLDALFGSKNIVVLAPDSRSASWDIRYGSYDVDVEFINRALDHTFSRIAVDRAHIALGGFSDGASYALSLGVTNGDLFTHVVGFSPGFYRPDMKRGKPPIFISHGTKDPILQFDNTQDELVPLLKTQGYNVEFVSFDGGHAVPFDIASRAMDWYVGVSR
jgi:phospholipase/carboxylesterase